MILAFVAGGNSYVVVVDASVRENHESSAQVTEHQVETGSNITDHVRAMPDRLQIEGVVTNTPIVTGLEARPPLVPSQNFFGAVSKLTDNTTGLQFNSQFDRVKDVDRAFAAAKDAGALIQAFTSLRSYKNMVIEGYSVERDAEKGNALHFKLDMKCVRFVDTQGIAVSTRQVEKVKKAAKAPEVDSEKKVKEKSRSVGHALAHKVGAAVSGLLGIP